MSLIEGPLSAVQGAVEAVKYARAFVRHAPCARAGLYADDDERGLILVEELGVKEPTVPAELPPDRV